MPHTRILDESEVTLDILKAAVNLRYAEDDDHVIVSGNAHEELVRYPASLASAAACAIWTFLEGQAFSHTKADEVYACLVLMGEERGDTRYMTPDDYERAYERIARSLPDFSEGVPGSWYLALEFENDMQFAYVEYLPNDPDGQWLLSIIHSTFVDHSW